MSSEESGKEADKEVLLVRPLPWRSPRVKTMLDSLDSRIQQGKSALARRQAKKRVASEEPSSRPKPTSQPPWAVI